MLRDREHLARDGVIVAGPEIVARGVIPLKQASEGELAEAARRVRQAIKRGRGQIEYDEIVEPIKETVSRLVWLRLHLRPLILPVVTQM